MTRQQEFKALIEVALDSYRERAEDTLRKLLKRSLPEQARVLWFGIQSGTQGLPVHIFAMDEEAVNEVFIEDPRTGKLGAIVSEPLVPGQRKEYIPQKVIYDYDEHVPVGGYEYAAKLIARFVRECYIAAGGKKHPLRAFAAHHDRGVALNLKNGKWVDTEDIHRGKV